jgi:hypothetical protein
VLVLVALGGFFLDLVLVLVDVLLLGLLHELVVVLVLVLVALGGFFPDIALVLVGNGAAEPGAERAAPMAGSGLHMGRARSGALQDAVDNGTE